MPHPLMPAALIAASYSSKYLREIFYLASDARKDRNKAYENFLRVYDGFALI